MNRLLVTEHPKRFPLHVPGVQVVAARDYLTDSKYNTTSRLRIFNLCRSYRYQTVGYYVSLLATARGHKPLPSIATLQDLRLQPVIRVASIELERLIQSSLKPLKSDTFELSIYFGRNLAHRYDPLSLALFNQFPAPFLRAAFEQKDGWWNLQSVGAIAASDIPEDHHPFVIEQIQRYFERGHRPKTRKPTVYDLAILVDSSEVMPPSNGKAIRRFTEAAENLGMGVEIVERDSYGRIGEFDALFIRETTSVNHHTFRFARRATAEGLVVIDDPDSIVKCSNKVFLTELFDRHHVRSPKTMIVAESNAAQIRDRIGFPCVVKQPDSSFSRGVVKINSQQELDGALPALFAESELLIAQEFVPTPFDWRIGVIAGKPLFACKYYMARRHWQIIKQDGQGYDSGEVETFAIEDAPRDVVSLAVRAAKLIGSGLYGVDLKMRGGRPMIIEINDNPSIDAGYEDRVLGKALYTEIMRAIFDQLERNRSLAEERGGEA